MTNLDNGCDCRTAVLRTFDELRRRQMNKTAALESRGSVPVPSPGHSCKGCIENRERMDPRLTTAWGL